LDFSKTKIQDDVTEFFDFPILLKFFLYISKHVKKTKTLKTDAKKMPPLLHQKKKKINLQLFFHKTFNTSITIIFCKKLT